MLKFVLLYVHAKRREIVAPIAAILLCCACLLCHAGAGVQQASALDQIPDLSLQPLAVGGRAQEQQLPALDRIQWITGPAKASLGKVAEVNVPAGYKFADEGSARSLLERMKNPVPKDLVGILAPASGKWFAILEFGDIGYVRDDDKDRLDAGAMLNGVRRTITRQNKEGSKSGQVTIDSADWELRPVYDPSEHKLEWAIRIKTGGQAEVVINHAVRLFGRRGVLNVIAVQPYRPDLNLATLREIAKGLSFKAGEGYRDYQQGDKLARYGLADLVINENSLDSNSESGATQDESKAWWVRIGLGLLVFAGLVLAGIGLITVVLKRLWLKRIRSVSLVAEKQSIESTATPQPLLANQASQTQSVATATADAPENNQGMAVSRAMTGRNGETSKNRDRKRKKHSNFYEFYSHMIMELSSGDSVGFVPFRNGHSDEVKSSAPFPSANGVSVPDATKVLVTEASDLIESHQRLIEQQRKFIEEQNKLIEEKSKLIDIESRVLEKHSELFEE